ncbi:3-oxoacyl-[acyl-carrier-protein] synthase II [Desulfuromusa kysingii]|uniref:3-oxoacyl-[acyl-carrier-protein] synthase II n=1 Tax=Desulfuromusa kysingii TaxID=37625 RepID=A0A1H3VQ04_9BACT|nr:beta-ketoacyl synthase N-terminal-like domain-containing protein [Desulfuromusa kysingii]SDZ76761.1 3-oxoacyl-[acyl-carrier-protein] synthase II [Desulfuromusa kysingii]
MRMAIQGIGITGSFGSGVASFRAALQTGSDRSALAVDDSPRYRAGIEGLDEFIPKRALRRIDHFSRMTLLGACQALKDADLLAADRSRIGVAIASGYGALNTTFNFLDSYLDFGYSCSSPTHFSNSVHNAAAAHVSIQLKTTAPSLTVTQFEMSVPSALLSAQQWLAEGRVDQVLFGAVDESCEVLNYCREQFFGAGEKGPLRPFAFSEQSAVAGEGAVFFVLTRADHGANYGYVDEVILGNHLVCPLNLPQDDLFIIGADGHKECGSFYAELLNGRAAAAYAPLYGSFPAAAGFDLAAAAVSLGDRTLYASSDPVSSGVTSAIAPQKLDQGQLACLKFGSGGDYGLIRLSN